MPRRIGERRLTVIDADGDLSAALAAAKVPFHRETSAAALELASPDLVIVAPDQLTDRLFDGAPLLPLAQSGVNVLLFAQHAPRTLLDLPTVSRVPATSLRWMTDHPLLADLPPDVLDALMAPPNGAPRTHRAAMRPPANAPAVAIGAWPPETPSDDRGSVDAEVDAVVVAESIGRGRAVFCQLPFGRFDEDPRAAIFLSNAIDYLLAGHPPIQRPGDRPIAARPAEAVTPQPPTKRPRVISLN